MKTSLFVSTVIAAVALMMGTASAHCGCKPHHYTPRHHVAKKPAPPPAKVVVAPPATKVPVAIDVVPDIHVRPHVVVDTPVIEYRPPAHVVRPCCAPVQRPVARSCCPQGQPNPTNLPMCPHGAAGTPRPLEPGGSARTLADGRCAMELPNGVRVTGYKWDDNRCHVKPPV